VISHSDRPIDVVPTGVRIEGMMNEFVKIEIPFHDDTHGKKGGG